MKTLNDITTDYYFEIKIDGKWITGVNGELPFVKKYYDAVDKYEKRIIRRTIKSETIEEIWVDNKSKSS